MLNGFALYTTWTVIASLVNLVQAWNYVDYACDDIGVLCSEGRDRMKTSCLVSLSLLVLFHTTYFCLENFVYDRMCR